MKIGWGLLLTLWMTSLAAFDESPWFTRFYEVYPTLEYRWQNYPSVNHKAECDNFSSNDHFFTFGLGATLCLPKDWMTPTKNCNVQGEFTLAQTHSQGSLHANDFQVLLRQPLSEDTVGEDYSSTVGIKFIQASRPARRDIGVFVHGGFSGEAQFAIGKEFGRGAEWSFRNWALLAAGVGDTGSPWLRADATVETQYCDFWINSLVLHTLFGLGHSTLCPNCFHGYGSIRHQSVDLGYTTTWKTDRLNLKAGAFYRLYARNCPEKAVQVIAKIEFPFGL